MASFRIIKDLWKLKNIISVEDINLSVYWWLWNVTAMISIYWEHLVLQLPAADVLLHTIVIVWVTYSYVLVDCFIFWQKESGLSLLSLTK